MVTVVWATPGPRLKNTGVERDGMPVLRLSSDPAVMEGTEAKSAKGQGMALGGLAGEAAPGCLIGVGIVLSLTGMRMV